MFSLPCDSCSWGGRVSGEKEIVTLPSLSLRVTCEREGTAKLTLITTHKVLTTRVGSESNEASVVKQFEPIIRIK